MANPVAHAMVFYANSSSYDALVAAARDVAGEIRKVVATLPGKALSEQSKPMRTEKHYRKYKGDGPARMMAKFRTFKKSQLVIEKAAADEFDATLEKVTAALAASTVSDASDTTGWETITQIPLRDDAVYIGLTNPYIEDKMIRINSRFRGDSKSDLSPYPGVDHVAALPTEVLIVKDGDETLVLHYGQMWRMQLYFWDSGYRAFTANVGVPSAIAKSIKSGGNLWVTHMASLCRIFGRLSWSGGSGLISLSCTNSRYTYSTLRSCESVGSNSTMPRLTASSVTMRNASASSAFSFFSFLAIQNTVCVPAIQA
jgi:hypothetical protein